MEHKSLRQLAKELGVSPSYLSQVQHGKRPPSQKVLSKVLSNFKQNGANLLDLSINSSYDSRKQVAESADAADLKSAGAILVGSSPTLGICYNSFY